ncbi:hypothetical protein Lal_00027365 [Lupinus albus]|nr:hypothetical protein Lal_00027365 [Lupinus albus]
MRKHFKIVQTTEKKCRTHLVSRKFAVAHQLRCERDALTAIKGYHAKLGDNGYGAKQSDMKKSVEHTLQPDPRLSQVATWAQLISRGVWLLPLASSYGSSFVEPSSASQSHNSVLLHHLLRHSHCHPKCLH